VQAAGRTALAAVGLDGLDNVHALGHRAKHLRRAAPQSQQPCAAVPARLLT